MSPAGSSGLRVMDAEMISAQTVIESPAEAVFAVLADPGAHPAIDGTGWVRASLDAPPLTEVGQVFRMAMYHEQHPDKSYEMANMVVTLDPPRAIAWTPGQMAGDTGEIGFGGWQWRYDLTSTGPSQTTVTLTYDWSAVPQVVRDRIPFPPFSPDHLDHSLQHLGQLVTG